MWFRADDKLHSNAKVRRVRRTHPDKRRDAAAMGVWFQAATWSADNKMDGFVPEEVVETYDDDWESIVERLCAATGPSGAGLFEPAEVGGEPGWIVHDFLQFNDSRDKQEKDLRAKRMRQALQRDVALITSIKRRDKDRCRYCGTQVNWRAHNGEAAATYDHVKPISAGGTNTLENVVVCCKGCNDRKGARTLRDAGMRLLDPGSLGAPLADEVAPDSAPARSHTATPAAAKAEGSTSGSGRVGSGRVGVSMRVQHADEPQDQTTHAPHSNPETTWTPGMSSASERVNEAEHAAGIAPDQTGHHR